ncbi:MAG: hypothetical protein EOP56_09445 [Sphingobacteriales bacterium]|nr:MAG: hypothetical protein EOP56_09445 [Sphingobacteriales bacterium]
MLRVVTKIVIEQQTPPEYPTVRNNKFTIDFVNEYQGESSWENLTDTFEVTLPKSVYVLDKYGNKYNLFGTNKNIGGGTDIPPLFLRGDKITVDAGYWHYTETGVETLSMTGTGTIPHLFEGFITQVKSDTPFTLECEDYFYTLKQVPSPKKNWKGVSIDDMIRQLVKGTGITVSQKSKISIGWTAGHYSTTGESVATVLSSLRSQCHLECYMRGKELRVGYPIYYEDEARQLDFCFNGAKGNIIQHDLTYQRKDDIVLSAVASSTMVTIDGVDEDGTPKEKRKQIELLIVLKNGRFTVIDIEKGESVPPNTEGQRRDFPFTDNTPRDKMIMISKERLMKYYYDGFSGSFTTFGLPFVKHGDTVNLTDDIMPERNGRYKVKQVGYNGGVNGLRQTISLDYKLL